MKNITTLSIIGWIDGISDSVVVILGVIFGFFFIYEAKVKKRIFLFYLAIFSIFAGLLYLGVMLDFISILTTGNNFPHQNAEVALVSYIFFAPVMIVAIYLVMSLKYKSFVKYIVSAYIVLGIIFTILIFLDPHGSFYIGFYEEHEPRLVDYNINVISVAGIFLISMLVPVIVLYLISLIYYAKRAKGAIRERFMILSIGVISYGIFGALEGFYTPSIEMIIIIVFIRAGYLSSFWLMYLGLRTIKTSQSDKEMEYDDPTKLIIEKLGLDFTRPEDLTEEEINFYRERIICLVCKKQIMGFYHIFVCSECKALYCENCAKALTNLENVCWSCGKTIDESKPTKPIKIIGTESISEEDREIRK